MSDLLSHLKRGTADKHTALENALALMRPAISRDEYIALLSGFRGFVSPWEKALRVALPAELQDFAIAREKTALLDDDLAFLTSNNVDRTSLPMASLEEVGLHIKSVASAIGSMYVMEGSTLGGRFIAPAMAKRFGLEAGRGYRYFDPYGARTGSMWNAFKETAAAQLAPEEHDEAVSAARATFDALFAWLPHADAMSTLAAVPEAHKVPMASQRTAGRNAI